MKKYVWSKTNNGWLYEPYAILECDDETANEMKRLKNDSLWMFIANRLYKRYPNKFPYWFDNNGEKHIFWTNNIIENYFIAYNMIVEERIDTLLKENSDDNETIIDEIKWRVEEELENLPTFVL